LKNLISRAEENEQIDILLETTVKEMNGFAGSFLTTLDRGGKRSEVAHGVAILATGAKTYLPSEYGYGNNDNIYTWDELSARLLHTPDAFTKADCAVFIQCVGSREPVRPHCSNLCCTFAVRTAVDLKAKNPDMDIYVLYREMRTFGEREILYREAREKGVIFIRYDLDQKPVVEPLGDDGRLKVTVHDPILGQYIAINADFISLQTAIIPEGNDGLSDLFHVELDPDGFFAESPQKLQPMETSRPGVYMAGLGHYPKDTGGSITQARGAAARAMEILKRDNVETGGLIAEVRTEKCAVCCTCVRTCPFQIPVIDHDSGAAYIDPALCRGCGMCVAECPGKAIVMSSCSDEMLNRAPSFLLMGHGSEV
jgi:heterodisulfide reductase subunit A2